METQKGMTSAEKTLSTMATVVLVLGVLSTIITFFTSCLIWDKRYSGFEFEGFNWVGIPMLLYVLMGTLTAWSILSIIVEIAMNVRLNKITDNPSWTKDFVTLIAINQKERAKEILYKEILSSSSFSEYMKTVNETHRQHLLDTINKEYKVFLTAIQEDSFKIDYSNKIYNVFR